jgi:hypothetical protein
LFFLLLLLGEKNGDASKFGVGRSFQFSFLIFSKNVENLFVMFHHSNNIFYTEKNKRCEMEYHVVYKDGTCVYWGKPNPNHAGFRVGPARAYVHEETPKEAFVPHYNTTMSFFKDFTV